jgi:hypothetical protein
LRTLIFTLLRSPLCRSSSAADWLLLEGPQLSRMVSPLPLGCVSEQTAKIIFVGISFFLLSASVSPGK